jgi:hypothetical protein
MQFKIFRSDESGTIEREVNAWLRKLPQKPEIIKTETNLVFVTAPRDMPNRPDGLWLYTIVAIWYELPSN